MTESSQGSIGVYLARQRRLRGISLDDLSDLTKIPRRSLERLEAGAFDGNSDGFARGFVRTVAEALGLEAKDAVLRLLGEPDEADDKSSTGRARLLHRALIAGAAAVVISIGAGAVWWISQPPSAPSEQNDPVPDASAIVYRRDAVRALAESQARRAPPAFENEPVDSTGGDPPHGSADPPNTRYR